MQYQISKTHNLLLGPVQSTYTAPTAGPGSVITSYKGIMKLTRKQIDEMLLDCHHAGMPHVTTSYKFKRVGTEALVAPGLRVG